jgi:PEP-CTERM motif
MSQLNGVLQRAQEFLQEAPQAFQDSLKTPKGVTNLVVAASLAVASQAALTQENVKKNFLDVVVSAAKSAGSAIRIGNSGVNEEFHIKHDTMAEWTITLQTGVANNNQKVDYSGVNWIASSASTKSLSVWSPSQGAASVFAVSANRQSNSVSSTTNWSSVVWVSWIPGVSDAQPSISVNVWGLQTGWISPGANGFEKWLSYRPYDAGSYASFARWSGPVTSGDILASAQQQVAALGISSSVTPGSKELSDKENNALSIFAPIKGGKDTTTALFVSPVTPQQWSPVSPISLAYTNNTAKPLLPAGLQSTDTNKSNGVPSPSSLALLGIWIAAFFRRKKVL